MSGNSGIRKHPGLQAGPAGGGAPGRTAAASLAAGALLLLTACAPSGPEREAAPLERVVVEQGRFPDAEDALRRTAFRLGASLASDPDTNQVTSPLSALHALSMLRAGAATTTAIELDEVLGLPVQHRDEAMNALLASVQRFDGDPGEVDEEDPPSTPLLHLANAVFTPDDGSTGRPFLNILASQYGSGVYPVDFGDPSTRRRIDAWVSEETGGRIAKAPLDVGPQTTLSLLNAVYFAAAWDEPFDANSSHDADFTPAQGSTVPVHTMVGDRWVRYADGGTWRGIDLPYGDGFFMRLVLPAEGLRPGWNEDGLLDIARQLDAAPDVRVSVSLPSWDHADEQDLSVILTALGLEEAMGADADYSGIRPGTVVAGASQVADITVAEKGTVAAAVTQFSMTTSAPVPAEISIAFDRPFGYQIVHEDTGLPVLLGTVADPRS